MVLNALDIVAINYWIGNWLLITFKYAGQINKYTYAV